MKITLKLAIFQSGRRQWEVAHEAGISDSRLCKYIRDYGKLTDTDKRRLEAGLGVPVDP